MDAPGRHSTRLAHSALGAAAAMGALVLGVAALPAETPLRTGLLALLQVAAPAAALAAAITAFRALPGHAGRPWVIMGSAATSALLAELAGHWYADTVPGHATLLILASMALLAIGTGWILHQRDRGRPLELGLDAGLAVTAATVATLHWAPAAAALDDSTATIAGTITLLGTPIAAGCAFLLAAALLLVRGAAPPGPAAPALVAATAAFGVAVAPLALGAGGCCITPDWSGSAYAAGWFALAYAGVRAAGGGPSGPMAVVSEAGSSRAALVVAPAVVAVLAGVLVDWWWRAPPARGTVVVLVVLGVLLALRVMQLLYVTRSHGAERSKLGETRALIEVSHALSRTRELEETLRLVAYWAVQLLQARAATIELVTPDGRWLEPRAVMGLSEETLQLRFPVDHSFTGWVVQHGKARAAADAAADQLMHPLSRMLLQHSSVAAAPLRYADRTFGALTCIGHYPFTARDMELLGAFAEQAAVAIETARLFQEVTQLSMTDPLTGLANRRQLEKDLAREFAVAQRGRQLVAVMFDLNDFKQFNDRAGHIMGDEALRHFGAALAASTRTMNMAARYGGDEFIALLADADLAGTKIFIQRVRDRFPGGDERFAGLTVAAGYAVFHPEMASPAELVAAADRALYEDKAAYASGSANR